MGLAPSRPLIIPPVARLYIAPGNPLSRPLSQSRNFILPCTPVNSAIKLRCIIQILLSNARPFGSRLYGILSGLPWHSFPSFFPVLLLFLYSFCFTSFYPLPSLLFLFCFLFFTFLFILDSLCRFLAYSAELGLALFSRVTYTRFGSSCGSSPTQDLSFLILNASCWP